MEENPQDPQIKDALASSSDEEMISVAKNDPTQQSAEKLLETDAEDNTTNTNVPQHKSNTIAKGNQ